VAIGRGGQETAGPGWLRASDADRERVVGVLKAAFVEGRLTRDVAAVIMVVAGAFTGSAAGAEANGLYLMFIMTFVVAFIAWLWTVSAHRGGPPAGQPPQRRRLPR
jgi:Domain of unknown function (DUF1707)